ncbi:MAG: hypothetical protein ABEI57_00950 [Halapricum sp.]
MDYPDVPESRLEDGGWEQCVRTDSTVFRTLTASIIGHTLVYEDAVLRNALDRAGFAEAIRSASTDADSQLIETGEDGEYWRFFFATALSFRPPLAPGVGPASMRPTVVSQARRSFEQDLRSRGFENVQRGSSQRVRTASGERASLGKVTASCPFEGLPTDELRIEGWVAVWATGGAFRIAGGAYPIGGLDGLLASIPAAERPTTDPNDYRAELLDLIRAVR